MRRIALAALLVASPLLVSAPTSAADKGGPKPATRVVPDAEEHAPVSCYAQGLVSSTVARAKVPELTVAASGFGGTAGLGCDLRLNAKIAIGALARLDMSRASATLNDGHIDLGTGWMIGGRLGYYVNPTVMVYGLAGMQSQDFKIVGDKLDSRGLVYGLGTEIALARSLALTVEYTRANLGNWTDGGIEIKPATDAVRLGLTVKLH